MASGSTEMPEILPDVLRLVFQQLAGDTQTLFNVSLASRAWRSLALPSIYQIVDISSHNNGRVPEHDYGISVAYAHDRAEYRPRNLVPRQRAFLRLMTNKPQLAKYVKSFTWTFIWMDFEEHKLADIDRQTWNVFSKMGNVTHLDLGSLHEVSQEDDYVRKNPVGLFPKVNDLKLLGCMHRGLVRAILTSLNACKLQSLKLDYLEDQGALPNGEPMSADFAARNAHNVESMPGGYRSPPSATKSSDIFYDELIVRQETGQAYIFPGPMWLPLHILSACALDSLTHLQVKVHHFDTEADLRSYHTFFQQTAALIIKVRETLESLVVVFGTDEHIFYTRSVPPNICRNGHFNKIRSYRPWCIKMAKLFMEHQLAALNENTFPRLQTIRFEGFDLLKDASPDEVKRAGLASLFQSIENCRFTDATFTTVPSLDYYHGWFGYEGGDPDNYRFAELLANS